jgi:hypothetical protein
VTRGQRHWNVTAGHAVSADLTHWSLAAGRAGGHDVIISGSDDGTVGVWDAVTGESAWPPLTAHGGPVTAVAAGRAGDRDVIISIIGLARRRRPSHQVASLAVPRALRTLSRSVSVPTAPGAGPVIASGGSRAAALSCPFSHERA